MDSGIGGEDSDDGLGHSNGSSGEGGVTPPGGGMEMTFDEYDIDERDRIRAGVFEVDSERVGAVGADFIGKVRRLCWWWLVWFGF